MRLLKIIAVILCYCFFQLKSRQRLGPTPNYQFACSTWFFSVFAVFRTRVVVVVVVGGTKIKLTLMFALASCQGTISCTTKVEQLFVCSVLNMEKHTDCHVAMLFSVSSDSNRCCTSGNDYIFGVTTTFDLHSMSSREQGLHTHLTVHLSFSFQLLHQQTIKVIFLSHSFRLFTRLVTLQIAAQTIW